MKKVISIRAPFTLCRRVCCCLYWEQKKTESERERKASSTVWWKLTGLISFAIIILLILSLIYWSRVSDGRVQGAMQLAGFYRRQWSSPFVLSFSTFSFVGSGWLYFYLQPSTCCGEIILGTSLQAKRFTTSPFTTYMSYMSAYE